MWDSFATIGIGLMDQLASECVDWNEQAVRSAENYLEFQALSRQGMVDQLGSTYGEQFTPEQARYAADQVGP